MIIEQFLSGFHYGDAVGNSVLRFHEFLLKKGIESRIIAITIDDKLVDKSISFNDYTEVKNSIKIYHFSIASPLTEYFLKIKGKKVIVYHNITPSHFFTDFSTHLVRSTIKGREELISLSETFDLAIADSYYNGKELNELGYNNIKRFPVMISRDTYMGMHSKGYFDIFNDGRKNIIFVGRITPNKKIEDLIKILHLYKNNISGSIRLIIAGKTDNVPEYYNSIRKLVSGLEINSSDLVFTGHIPFNELLSVYRAGDVFLSMSEHEGFCLPLIESSFFNIPVVAYNAGAVKETLGGSGIVMEKKDFKKIAFLLEKVLNDNVLNKKLKDSAGERSEEYQLESNPGNLLALLQKV
ncbi:MAG: glycosyltransferase family 4 protein [Acidobacteriota bacterium]